MVAQYHRQFFSDVRSATFAIIGLLVLGFGWAPQVFLLVPVVAILGANQTAFDASYLMFARQYATRLETYLNSAMRKRVLVAAELEDSYLFPLARPKIVTVPVGRGFTWFAWMTILYTVLGLLASGAGVALGWGVLAEAGSTWTLFYLGSLAGLLAVSLVVGVWWFVGGSGEARLERVLNESFLSVE